MEKNTDYILFSYAFDGKGGGKPLVGKEISKEIKDNNPAWVHLDVNSKDTKKWLKDEIQYIDPLIIDALIAEETRPRLEEFEEGSLLILRGVNLNEGSEPEDMISIRVWIDKHRIISLERRKLQATRAIEKKIKNGKGPKNAADFAVMLSHLLTTNMEPVISKLIEEIDDLEEGISEDHNLSVRSKIVNLRKEAVILRRYISPQKEVINRLRNLDQKWIDKKHKTKLHEIYDRVTRYIEDLDLTRERAQIIQEELQDQQSEKMNKNMYILSVIAAIFLPLGFLTGLLGINVGGIPGSENQEAFYIFSGILTGIVALQLAVFKKLKWI